MIDDEERGEKQARDRSYFLHGFSGTKYEVLAISCCIHNVHLPHANRM